MCLIQLYQLKKSRNLTNVVQCKNSKNVIQFLTFYTGWIINYKWKLHTNDIIVNISIYWSLTCWNFFGPFLKTSISTKKISRNPCFKYLWCIKIIWKINYNTSLNKYNIYFGMTICQYYYISIFFNIIYQFWVEIFFFNHVIDMRIFPLH